MIHLVTRKNRQLYEPHLVHMHVERKIHFIDGRGWRLQERDGGEYDAYDDDEAYYLIGFDPAGRIGVSARLRPTLSGGLIPDLFSQLIAPAEQPTKAPGVFECTRYFTARELRGAAGFEGRSRLHISLIEAMLDLGGHRLIGFSDLELLTHLRRFSGLRLRPIGLPSHDDEGGAVVAFEIGVTPADLEHARRSLQIDDRQLFIAPDWLPSGVDVLALERAVAVLVAAPEGERHALREHVGRLAADIVYHRDVKAVMASLAADAA